jgi:hypothetical protein
MNLIDPIALVAFAAMFGGLLLGFALGKIMPERYRGAPTERIVQNGVRMISLLSLLVLGLLVASAKSKFDTINSQNVHFAANLMLLNSELVNYGPGTEDIKPLLKKFAVAEVAETWSLKNGPRPDLDDPPAPQLIESIQQKLLMLTPASEYQRAMARSASQIVADIVNTRWLRSALVSDHSPEAFVWVLMAWLSILFVAFGLFAPPNFVTIAALLVCALSMCGAIGLILDLDKPFMGIVTVSPEPMLNALAKISALPIKRAN